MAYQDEGNVPTARRFRGRLLKVALAAVLPLVPLSVVYGQAEDPVEKRQQLMRELDDDAETLGTIAALAPSAKGAQLATYKTQMAEASRRVATAAKESHELFKANVPGGRSKPEIWTNWADYNAKMEAFVANSEKMAKVAETGDLHAVTELLVDALPCKGCHDVYREKKTS
jgi:cytochrome c556